MNNLKIKTSKVQRWKILIIILLCLIINIWLIYYFSHRNSQINLSIDNEIGINQAIISLAKGGSADIFDKGVSFKLLGIESNNSPLKYNATISIKSIKYPVERTLNFTQGTVVTYPENAQSGEIVYIINLSKLTDSYGEFLVTRKILE
jgi:hypothetical protein